MRARVLLACLALATSACGGRLEGDFSDAAVDAPVDAPPLPPVVPVVRVHAWPGGGMQLTVAMPDEVASEAGGGLPEAWLETAGGGRIDAVVARAGVTTGLTAIVVAPTAEPAEHARRIAAADALVQALPAGERVAVFVARDGRAHLLADLMIPRDHARDRLAALAPEASPGGLLAAREVEELLEDVQSSAGMVGRTAIVVGDYAPAQPPEVRRIVHLLAMHVDDTPENDAAFTVSELTAHRGSLVRIGACGALAENTAFTLHLGRGHALDLAAPAAMDYLSGHPCDAAAAAADRFPFPAELELTFTPEERVLFDQVNATRDENTLWRTSVRLGPGAPIAATGHLRGQGTLNCARKSMSVELDGPRRRLMPDVGVNNFLLISMCFDDHYFGQMFADRLLNDLDLFMPRVRYTKLKIDGVNRGVYLLMEQADNSLRDNMLSIATVVRRRYDIDNQPAEVKYPDDPVVAAEVKARFEAIGDRARHGAIENLDADLDALVDLDHYTRLLASYSLLQNGDYIDEFYFYASTEGGAEHYRAMGWDTDDVFSPCHGGGGRPINDRCGLTYCAEAELDYALVRDPATYNRFLRGLDDVLAQATPARMEATMMQVRDELFAVLDDEETARALEEIGRPSLEQARAAIQGRMTTILGQAATNHASLLGRRASCPLTP